MRERIGLTVVFTIIICGAILASVLSAQSIQPVGITGASSLASCAYLTGSTVTICGTPAGVYFATSAVPTNWQSMAQGAPSPPPSSLQCDYALSTVGGKQHIALSNCK